MPTQELLLRMIDMLRAELYPTQCPKCEECKIHPTCEDPFIYQIVIGLLSVLLLIIFIILGYTAQRKM